MRVCRCLSVCLSVYLKGKYHAFETSGGMFVRVTQGVKDGLENKKKKNRTRRKRTAMRIRMHISAHVERVAEKPQLPSADERVQNAQEVPEWSILRKSPLKSPG